MDVTYALLSREDTLYPTGQAPIGAPGCSLDLCGPLGSAWAPLTQGKRGGSAERRSSCASR